MGTVTGLTAERMLEIEAASVVDGDIVGDDLFLTKHDGTVINAGNVRGGPGPAGPRGDTFDVVTAKLVSDVGIINQIRAGRQLSVADFTSMGLSAPLGLWNMSNANDSSGNARNLTNKGAVPFGVGINGLASTAAVYAGSTGQVLYFPDSGGADPFRLKTFTVGCWFRTARRSIANQNLIGKWSSSSGQQGPFLIEIDGNNKVQVYFTFNGSAAVNLNPSITDVCDDRWHFMVFTYDGMRAILYIDGQRESTNFTGGSLFGGSGALGIGARASDAVATSLTNPNFGRIDEAFILGDVANDEQQRNLYCASIPHALSVVPASVNLGVRRKRRGAPLAPADFPVQPLRLYNFANGALTDEGSQNVPLTNPSAYSMLSGADGRPNHAVYISNSGAGLQAADATLPLGTATRSYGCWFKCFGTTIQTLISWGNQTTPASSDLRLQIITNFLRSLNGGDNLTSTMMVADGQWHFAVVVYDNGAADGCRHKLYCDGELIGSSTGAGNPLVSGGATGFRVGIESAGFNVMNGQIDVPFVMNVALTFEQQLALYDKGVQALALSPDVSEKYVEAMETARLLATFDGIESSDSIDLVVMS
jgi:hypothetical protein